MSAHVLLNLLNEQRKRDKIRGLSSILSLFRNVFNKVNNTGARMLDSIYQHGTNITKESLFGVKTSRFCSLLHKVQMNVIALRYKICKSLVVYRFNCMALHVHRGYSNFWNEYAIYFIE